MIQIPSLTNPRTRKYIYNVALAFIPVAVALGLISESMAPLIVVCVTSILGLGLAQANVPTGEDV